MKGFIFAGEIPSWALTDVSGNFNTTGTFAADAAGKHMPSVEIAGLTSNILPLEVVRRFSARPKVFEHRRTLRPGNRDGESCGSQHVTRRFDLNAAAQRQGPAHRKA